MSGDEKKEEGSGGTNPAIRAALARHPLLKALAKGLLVALPALVAGLVGTGAADDADDKARAGYTVTRSDIEAIKGQLVRLEAADAHHAAELAALRRLARAGRRPPRAEPTPAPAPAEAPAPLPPLPATVEEAVKQVQNTEGGTR